MITILDYGSGNLSAISTLAKLSDIKYEIIDSPAQIKKARKILLPGVGAFDNTMGSFQKSGMADALKEQMSKGHTSLLGICIGMHVLGDQSDEGDRPGLGLIGGKIKKFNPDLIPHRSKTPHMGWNSILPTGGDHPLLKNIDLQKGFYFLHSYYFDCANPDHVIGRTEHGEEFHSIIEHNNIFGVQFHPEKSHQNGITLIKNFLEI